MITKEEVEHVGWLARIEIAENESETYAKKLNSVLGYFEQLDEVDTEDVLPTYHVADVMNVFREDVVKPSMSQEDVLSNVEDKQEGSFKVPKIM